MRLKEAILSRLVNFLLGAAWAIALLGALAAFLSFYHASLFLALFSALLGAIPGLLIVLFLEYLMLQSEAVDELREQTRLLKEMHGRIKPQ